MKSYKKLDNLCKDLLQSESGVTAYIDAMDEIGYNRFRIENWETDYRQLKAYRHIRNQIAHADDIDEENTCTMNDVYWLQSFYQRILSETDPLSLHRKANMASQQTAQHYTKTTNQEQLQQNHEKWQFQNTDDFWIPPHRPKQYFDIRQFIMTTIFVIVMIGLSIVAVAYIL